MRVDAAAFRNQPPMWLSTASLKIRSRPIRVSSTCAGTLPFRKPGTLSDRARSEVACSTACWRSACGTSTVRRTRLSGSSSTCGAMTRPIQAKDPRLPVGAELGGLGGTSLVVGVRRPFRGKDAGSPCSGLLQGRLRTQPGGGQRGPTAQTRFRQALLIVVGLAVAVVEVVEPRDQPDAAKVDLVRAGVVRDVVRLAGPVDQVSDPLGARDDRVGDPRCRRPRDDVPRPKLKLLSLRAVRRGPR